jgi:tRNA pseudouridine55 synthase
MDAVLNIRKPEGPTSHDIVGEVRRMFGLKRVGHAGTLDPMATGVLIVCLGKATRIVEYLMGQPKEYRARMTFGVTTDTQDSTGIVTSERDPSFVTRGLLEQTAARFVGEIEQVPPMVSALKHQGRPLYKLAREGRTVDRPARPVSIYSIDVLSFSPPSALNLALPQADLLVRCSSGTYIRTLCADIGEALGCGAHMSALERTRVGRFTLEDSVTLDDLREAQSSNRLEDCLLSIDEALTDMPGAAVRASDVERLLNGNTVPAGASAGEGATVRILAPDGALLAIGSVLYVNGQPMVKPGKVLASPVACHSTPGVQ